MKKHQTVAIILGSIVAIISSIPVFITIQKGLPLSSPKVIDVFLYPTIGVSVAAIIIFISFLKDSNN